MLISVAILPVIAYYGDDAPSETKIRKRYCSDAYVIR
jgi:hypothetical protein